MEMLPRVTRGGNGEGFCKSQCVPPCALLWTPVPDTITVKPQAQPQWLKSLGGMTQGARRPAPAVQSLGNPPVQHALGRRCRLWTLRGAYISWGAGLPLPSV